MKEYLMLSFRLMLISLIAGLLLSGTYHLTQDEITAQQAQKAAQAMAAVMPGNGAFDLVYESADASEAVQSVHAGNGGYVYIVRAQGYGSAGVTVTVGIKDGVVSGIIIDASGETPGLGTKAGDEAFGQRFMGVNADAAGQVQGISGATTTSNAVKSAVAQALDNYALNYAK